MPFFEGAAGAVAGQAANQLGSDAILQSIFNPAMIQGTDAIVNSALAPSIANIGVEGGMDALLNASLGNAAIGSTAQNALQQGAGNIFGVGTNMGEQSFGSQLSDLFGDKGFNQAVDTGFKGFQLADTMGARKDAQKFQNEQLAMSKDAYNRNVEADEKRQSLNF